MEARAVTRYVRVAPRKARIVRRSDSRQDRSAKPSETLRFTNRAVAEIVEKTLNSAVANAAHKGHHRPRSTSWSSACLRRRRPDHEAHSSAR